MAYTTELYANNVRTTLAGSANNTVTTLVLQSGAGALFPSPNNLIGEYAKMDLQDTATGLRNEIIYITARTGDVLTVVRGQDGTTAQTWSAGDTAFMGVTAATLANFVQPSKLQNCQYTHAVAGGTANAITATYIPAYAAWVDGMTFFSRITAGNTTTTPTVSPNGLAAKTIVKGGGIALKVSDLVVGMIAEFKYSATLDKVILQNPYGTGQLLNIQYITATGAYTATEGTDFVDAELIGGGASGGGAVNTVAGYSSAGGGGGAGGYCRKRITSGFNGATITIGAGGAVGASGAAGNAGGSSSFGAIMTANGGGAGALGGAYNLPAVSSLAAEGGGSTGGDINIIGGSGLAGQVLSSGTIANLSGIGGASPLGFGGGQVGGTTNGGAGTGYGSGGSGGTSVAAAGGASGGAGKAGICIIREYGY